MNTVKLKTNIKCGNCIATVTPFLNEALGEGTWEVDIKDPKKVLTVENATIEQVRQAVEKAGYKAESLN